VRHQKLETERQLQNQGFNHEELKEYKGLSSFLDFMCLLPVLRRNLQLAFQFHFLVSCFPQSQTGGPHAHDDLLLRKSGNEESNGLCSCSNFVLGASTENVREPKVIVQLVALRGLL
jgi:hypothetical protein